MKLYKKIITWEEKPNYFLKVFSIVVITGIILSGLSPSLECSPMWCMYGGMVLGMGLLGFLGLLIISSGSGRKVRYKKEQEPKRSVLTGVEK